MHYDRESMEADEPNLAQRHRASLSLALREGGWVPRSVADNLAEAIEKTAAKSSSSHLGKTLAAYRAAYPREETP